jgi:hypothetical protein
VAAAVIFVFAQLQPNLIFAKTTPAGGDTGSHVWGPDYLRDHLLPKGRLTGWTPDWYAGFPAYQAYMVMPPLAIALLSYVVPYGVAFKLVAVSGCVTFPVACWWFGRGARMPFPAPALLSIGGLLFLFDRSFSIYGGNLASTLAGEFAFSISLSLAVFYLGVLARGLESGRHRGWAALLLALAALCHVIPALFVAVCTVLYVLVRPGRGRLAYVATVSPVAGLLAAFWYIPFLLRSGYMNDMGWERITSDRYLNYLWGREKLDPQLVNSPDLRWVVALAAVGLLLSVVFRRRGGLVLALMVGVFALGFMFVPQGRLWNARVLPFYYLSLYLLAAIGVAELGRLAASLVARDVDRPVRGVLWATPAAGGGAALVMLLLTFHALPGGIVSTDGQYSWGVGPVAVTSGSRSFIDSWAAWNFEGYEGLTDTGAGEQYRKSYPEYHDVVQTMAGIGRDRGCGRAMWEHEEAHDRYGTPMALMLLPFWTDGCIGSIEGLYFESSATTPYHFIQQDELSWAASNAQREMPYTPGSPTQVDFDRGVRHLQMMGVSYYMAINEQTQALAAANGSLERIASSGPWLIYRVVDAPLVQGLANRPAVLTDQPTTGHAWQDLSVCWWANPENWDVVLTSDGPADWQRVARTEHPDPDATPSQKCQPAGGWGWFSKDRVPVATPQEPVKVTNVVERDDGISFDVDRPGVPVLVKVSYFPNWKVSGAQGPWRATPNFMVVVPEGNHVDLQYGWTPVDLGSIALTLGGIVLLILLFRARPLAMAAPRAFFGRVERPDLYPADAGAGSESDARARAEEWLSWYAPDRAPVPEPGPPAGSAEDPYRPPPSPPPGPGAGLPPGQ